MSDDYSSLPEPTPLRRAAVIRYQWGEQQFVIWSTACSVRTLAWRETGEQLTWLHCKARPVAEITPDEPTVLMTVLIPAHYVTGIEVGPTFRVSKAAMRNDLGIFPPNQVTPPNRLALAEIEKALADLLDPSRN
jgi:hypothetical protein